MGRRIAPGVYTYANGTAYGPGDEPTPEDAAEIRNPACWEDGKAPAEPPAPSGAQGVLPEAPPRSGKGSGLPAWVAFAEAHEVATTGEDGKPLSREQIIVACEQVGVIEPEGDDDE